MDKMSRLIQLWLTGPSGLLAPVRTTAPGLDAGYGVEARWAFSQRAWIIPSASFQLLAG